LTLTVLGMLLFGLATQGWMMYAVTAFYCLGLGLLNPAVQGLMSRSMPANEQGLLQGAVTSVMTATAIVGPPLSSGLFAISISPAIPLSVPGAPFFLGSALCLVALWLARRQASQQTRPVRAASVVHGELEDGFLRGSEGLVAA